jgi:hypothetical protein
MKPIIIAILIAISTCSIVHELRRPNFLVLTNSDDEGIKDTTQIHHVGGTKEYPLMENVRTFHINNEEHPLPRYTVQFDCTTQQVRFLNDDAHKWIPVSESSSEEIAYEFACNG